MSALLFLRCFRLGREPERQRRRRPCRLQLGRAGLEEIPTRPRPQAGTRRLGAVAAKPSRLLTSPTGLLFVVETHRYRNAIFEHAHDARGCWSNLLQAGSSAPGPRSLSRWRSGSAAQRATASSSRPRTARAPMRTSCGWSSRSCSGAACPRALQRLHPAARTALERPGRRLPQPPDDPGGTSERTSIPTIVASWPAANACARRRVLRCRPRLPRSRGRLRSDRQGSGTGDRSGGAHEPGLGQSRRRRVNGIDTPWCHGDIIEVVSGARGSTCSSCRRRARPATSGGSMCSSHSSEKLGLRRRMGLEVLIEEAEGLSNAAEIARSSDRLEAIIFGAGDLSASCGPAWTATSTRRDYPGDFWQFARVQVLAAACGEGSMPSTRHTPPTRIQRGTGAPATHASLLGSMASGPYTPIRSSSPMRSLPPPPRRSRSLVRPSRSRASEADGVERSGGRQARRCCSHAPRREHLHKASLVSGGST